jgi:thymidylate synthase (FAD)
MHRMASVNEYSTRYSEAIDSCQTTSPDEWRLQSAVNKQGSKSGKLEWPDGMRLEYPGGGYNIAGTPEEHLSNVEKKFQKEARDVYESRLKLGIAKEQARKDLPLSTYTEAYWKIDLHNLFHFLRLRMDSHAQYEIRQYANIIGNEIVAHWVPIAWEAFQDYRLNAIQLTSLDIRMMNAIQTGTSYKLATEWGWTNKKSREGAEYLSKIQRLGIRSVWEQC